jgi:hypothetical protein
MPTSGQKYTMPSIATVMDTSESVTSPTVLRLTGAVRFITLQQLKVLFMYNQYIHSMRVAPGHASWWSSNGLNLNHLYSDKFSLHSMITGRNNHCFAYLRMKSLIRQRSTCSSTVNDGECISADTIHGNLFTAHWPPRSSIDLKLPWSPLK